MTNPIPPVLSEADVRQLVNVETAISAVRDAVVHHANGGVNQPSPWHLELPSVGGQVHVKGTHISTDSTFALKVATGFYRNGALGLPTSGGLSLIFDAASGGLVLIAADNGYLTDLRTGMAGAIAADALANPDSRSVAIIGSGIQARHQLHALMKVRAVNEIRIWSRKQANSDSFADELEALPGIVVSVFTSVEDAVDDADIVITTTPSTSWLLKAQWLKPGAHVTAVGTDSRGKQELHPSVFERAHLIAVDDPEECRHRGDLQHASNHDIGRAIHLGDVLGGLKAGCTNHNDITIADLIGIGAEDAAIASHLFASFQTSNS